ncbi:MAG: hypothetical protein EAZ99_12090 [Alphaproteobacteria bacterium]|nr:MAG: hypothetical protein EAZ99_12090 [Alphaproteobacteria bacterium]
MKNPIRFDTSLPALVAVLRADYPGDLAAAQPIVIRDFEGRLGVILDAPNEDLDGLNRAVIARLGPYARPDEPVRGRDAPGVLRLVEEATSVASLTIDGVTLRLLDRRIVGADWMAPPVLEANQIPRFAFVSIKGGVGRSTALSIIAAHLAKNGHRVLAVDLDLEAPGLGATLLEEKELPLYGVVDWLIENRLSQIDTRFRADCIGRSSLLDGVAVVPAFGSQTLDNPADALAKIARASLEDIRDGARFAFRDQVRDMIESFEATGDFDVVLIDGRAGLHETTATPVLGLGAKVLLFGINEPQTFQGYGFLLAHIRDRVLAGSRWEDNVWFVQAKADPGDAKAAEERFNVLWNRDEGGGSSSESLGPDDLELDWADSDASAPQPKESAPMLRILNDERYRNFNPVMNRTQLDERLVQSTFGEVLDWVDEQMALYK